MVLQVKLHCVSYAVIIDLSLCVSVCLYLYIYLSLSVSTHPSTHPSIQYIQTHTNHKPIEGVCTQLLSVLFQKFSELSRNDADSTTHKPSSIPAHALCRYMELDIALYT